MHSFVQQRVYLKDEDVLPLRQACERTLDQESQSADRTLASSEEGPSGYRLCVQVFALQIPGSFLSSLSLSLTGIRSQRKRKG